MPDVADSTTSKQLKPGRRNIYFCPISDVNILEKEKQALKDFGISNGFNPLFIHQNFDSEFIPEWSNDLAVLIFFHEYTLLFFIEVFGTLLAPEATDLDYEKAKGRLIHKLCTGIGIVPNDRENGHTEVYQNLLIQDLGIYKTQLKNSLCLPIHGELVQAVPLMNDDDDDDNNRFSKVVEIYSQTFGDKSSLLEHTAIPTATRTNPMGSSFQGFHRRFEYMMHFFIESCSAIQNDCQWQIYTAFICDEADMDDLHRKELKSLLKIPDKSTQENEKRATCTSVEEKMSAYNKSGRQAVAFVSVYKYLGLQKERKRISQFFTLPTFQGQGLASVLLKYLYNSIYSDPSVRELGVEDPALAFMQIRDVVGLEVAYDNNLLPVHTLMPNPDSQQDMNPDDSPPWNPSDAQGIPQPDSRYKQFTKGSTTFGESSLFGNVSSSLSGGLLGGQPATSSLAKKDITYLLGSLAYVCDYMKNIYQALRDNLKESEDQCARLCEILLLAKYLPDNAFYEKYSGAQLIEPPPAKKQKIGTIGSNVSSSSGSGMPASNVIDVDARSYRECKFVSESMAKRWANDPRIAPVRLFVQYRLLEKMDVDVGAGRQFTQDELIGLKSQGAIQSLDLRTKNQIQSDWVLLLYSYMRTLKKLRSRCHKK